MKSAEIHEQSISFVSPDGVTTYVAIVLRSGLALYAKTGMRPSSHWTPGRMMKRAASITGKTFKRGQYSEAITALDAWIAENGTSGHAS